jgi:hypothetical protein
MNPDFLSSTSARRFYLGAAVCVAAAMLWHVFHSRATLFWDFKMLYSAGWLVRHDQNPYDNHLLFPLSKPYGFPFSYPLVSTFLFVPFTIFNYNVAALFWLVAITAAWTAILIVWRKCLFPGAVDPRFPLVALLFFNFAVLKNMVTGNIATIETLLLWTGFLFLIKGNVPAFVAFLLCASSFKMVPMAFLIVPLVHPQCRRWKPVITAAALFVLYLIISYALAPSWFKAYQANLKYNVEAWALRDFNPSSYALSRRIVFGCCPSLHVKEHLLAAGMLYVIIAAIVLLVSIKVVRTLAKRSWVDVGPMIVFYSTLAYAMIVPRFCDYSYTLVIPAALYLIGKILPPKPVLVLIGGMLLPLFFFDFSDDPDFLGDFVFHGWAFWSLGMLFVCWAIFSVHVLAQLKHQIALAPVKSARLPKKKR